MEKICRNCKHWDDSGFESWARDPEIVGSSSMPCKKIWERIEVIFVGSDFGDIESLDTDPAFGCVEFEKH